MSNAGSEVVEPPVGYLWARAVWQLRPPGEPTYR
jgi:hypothetical protein